MNSKEKLEMLAWETKKGQANLKEKELIEKTRLIKETIPLALGEEVCFEDFFKLYVINNQDDSLTQINLIEEIIEIFEDQLGEDAEFDESNLIFILILIYEMFDSDNTKPFNPPNDSAVKNITI